MHYAVLTLLVVHDNVEYHNTFAGVKALVSSNTNSNHFTVWKMVKDSERKLAGI